MTTKGNEMEIQEQEMVPEETERTREYRCFLPRTDIFEVDDDILVVLDMPGINENAIEITLEKDILIVKGFAQINDSGDYSLVLSEYDPGDYERSFRISNAIDRENIEAIYNNGVLKLVLPKAEETRTKKIDVKVG